MNQINNKTVYDMYKGKLCMRHTVEFYTPITNEELGFKMFQGQLSNSDAHKKAMEDINLNIQEVLCDNLRVDVCKVQTTVFYGEVMNCIKEEEND